MAHAVGKDGSAQCHGLAIGRHCDTNIARCSPKLGCSGGRCRLASGIRAPYRVRRLGRGVPNPHGSRAGPETQRLLADIFLATTLFGLKKSMRLHINDL